MGCGGGGAEFCLLIRMGRGKFVRAAGLPAKYTFCALPQIAAISQQAGD